MAIISQYLDTIGTNHLIQALKKWQEDKLGNYVTLSTAQTITGTKTFQASIKSTTSGVNIEWGNIKIYGGGSNGGSNSILIGDDVTIGDCNIGGSFGMVSTGANAGFRFFNSSKASIGGIQSTNGTLQWFTGSELKNILHAGNSYIKGSTITIDGSSITPLTSLPSHTHTYLTVPEATQENLNSSYHNFQVLYIGGSNNFEGKPENVDAFGLFRFRVAYGWSGQMLLANGGDLYIRSAADASLNKSLAWKRVIDSGNVGSQSVAYATKAGSVAWDSITGKPSSFNPSSHNHDGRYLRLDGSDTMAGVLKVKANQYNDAYEGAINMNNSNIYGLNSIYTADKSDSQAEGIHFWRDATHVDTLRMMDGKLLFTPNRPLGGSGTELTVLHIDNSSVSGGGSSWGSSITVKIGGTSKTLTIPGNPNTWRPIGTGSNDAAAGNHTHGLLHYDLVKTIDNTTTDSGWSMINDKYNGAILKALRTQGKAPEWIRDNYAAGIAFGSADTKGVLSVAYGSAAHGFKIAGGSGSKPVWWMNIHGTSGKDYNLDAFKTEIPSSIKNPNPIKFKDIDGNVVSYDGSAAKDLTLGVNVAKLPYGFHSFTSGASWGNTTGTSIASWNDSSGGSIDFRRDNPSSGKMSIKVDGRVYVNEGSNPVLSASSNNGFWGIRTPDGNNDWVRTPDNGLIPYKSGGAGNGSSSLGTSSWYFSTAYIDKVYGNLKGTADNADTVDSWHKDEINRTLYITSGTSGLSSYWAKLWEINLNNQSNDVTITFLAAASYYPSYFAIFSVYLRQNGSGTSKRIGARLVELIGNIAVGDTELRLYVNNTTGNCQLWGNVKSQYGTMNLSVLKKSWRTANDSSNIGTFFSTAFSSVQSLPGEAWVKIGVTQQAIVGTFTPTAHEHNYILDIGSSDHITFAYSKPGLSKDSITWLAVWNGYELRAMNKDQVALSGHNHDDRYVKKIGDIPEKAYDLIISPTLVSGSSYIDTGGGIHVKANTGTKFQLWLHDTSNVWYKKTNDGAWKKMDAGQADNADTTDGVHITWSGTNDNPIYLASWDDNGKAIRAATRANVTVGNSDKLDGVHLNGIFTAFGNNGHNIKATIGGVSKEFLVNWAADADKLDGYHADKYLMVPTIIDASALNSDTYYPVTIWLPCKNTRIEVEVSLDSNTKPSWSTHQGGFTSRKVWESNGSGRGTTTVERNVFVSTYSFASEDPIRGIGQLTNSSVEFVYVRGGGKYYFRVSVGGGTPTLRKEKYTTNSQSVAPTTTAPDLIIPCINTPHRMVTLWGQNFNGTNSVSGSLSNTGTITASAAATYDIGSNSLDYRYGYFQWIGAKANTNLRLAANNSDNQIVLHTNGNVGVGTNSPSRKLHVAGNIYTSSVFEGPYARLTNQNGAVVIGNSTNARLSAIDQHIIFNTGGALRFGETDWDWNKWAGLKYTHSNKTIYLGIADGTIFPATSGQKGGTLKFPNVSTIEACSIRIEYTNEINSYSGDLYLNHRGNGGSNGNTANIRMLNNGGDLFLGGQLKFLASEAHIGHSSDYSDPWSGLEVNFKFGGKLAATHIFSNGGFHKAGSTESHVLLGGGGHALISDLGCLSSRRLLSNSEFAKGNNFLQYFNFIPNYTSVIGNAGPSIGDWYHIIRMNHGNNAGFFVELAAHFYDKGVFYRSVSSGSVNTNWKRFLTHNGTIAFTSFNTYYDDGVFDMDGNPNGASGLLSDSWNQTIINLGASFSKARIKQLAFNYSDDTIKYRRRGDSGWTTAKTIAFTDSTVAASNLAYTLFGKYTNNGGQQKPDYFGKNRVGALMMNTSVNGDAHYKDWLLMDCYGANDAGGGVAFGVNRQTLGAYIMRSNYDRGSWAESAELVGTHNFRRIFRQFYPSGGSDVIDVNYPLWVAYLSENSFLTAPNNSFTSINSSTGAVTQYNYETRWVPIAEGSEYCSFMLTLEDTDNSRANVYNFIVTTGHLSGEIHQLSTNDYGGVVRLHLMLRYSGQNWVLYLAASTTINNPTVGSTGGFTYGNSKYIAWIHVYLNTVLKGSPTLLTINDLCNKHRIPGTPASYGNSKPITPYFRNTNTDPTSSLTYEKTGGWSYKMLSPCPIKGATSEKTEFKSPSGKSSYIVIDPTITIPSTSYSSYETVLGYQGIKTYNINAAHINVGQLEVNTSANFTNSVYLTGVLYGLRVGVTAIWEAQTLMISDYKSTILIYKVSKGSSNSNKTSTIVLDDTRSGRMIWVKNTTTNELYIKPASGTIILEGRNYTHTADNALNISSAGDGMMFIFCPGAGSVGSVHYTVGIWEGFKHPRDW